MATCSDYVWSTWASTSTAASSLTKTALDTTLWKVWASPDATAGTATAVSSEDFTWKTWTTSSASTTSTNGADCDATDAIWYSWASYDVEIVTEETQRAMRPAAEAIRASREAIRQRQAIMEQQREERERRYAEMEKAKREAERVAQELLCDLIGEEELKIYKETGRLFVKGRRHDYVVRKKGMVQQIDKDKITDLCVHLKSRYSFPDTDNVVALKMALEADEDNVLQMANRHGSRPRDGNLERAACM